MDWISVFDMRPADGAKGDFLVWIDNGKTTWAGVYGYDEICWNHIGVTHWMPLPPAPVTE